MEKILFGKPVAEYLDRKSLSAFNVYEEQNGQKASIGAITVGDDPASMLYVKRKEGKAEELNVSFHWKKLDKDATQEDVSEAINEFSSLNGIILQLPIPDHLNADELIDLIPPGLDVDGLTKTNLGTLFESKPFFAPASPTAILELFNYYDIDLQAKDVLVLGRSRLVTAPLSRLLSSQSCNSTVTVLHSKSKNINEKIKSADIVISAIGKPYFLNHTDFKEGAIVIDVGISQKDKRIYGDVDPENTSDKLYARSPYPGGVGPVTVSALYANLALLIS